MPAESGSKLPALQTLRELRGAQSIGRLKNDWVVFSHSGQAGRLSYGAHIPISTAFHIPGSANM